MNATHTIEIAGSTFNMPADVYAETIVIIENGLTTEDNESEFVMVNDKEHVITKDAYFKLAAHVNPYVIDGDGELI